MYSEAEGEVISVESGAKFALRFSDKFSILFSSSLHSPGLPALLEGILPCKRRKAIEQVPPYTDDNPALAVLFPAAP